MSKVAVVVPTYRRPGLLQRCLDALRHQDVGVDVFEVAVVDDGSDDETPYVLASAADEMPNLTWASQPRNRGPAAARNRAVSMTSAPLILFLDDDVVAPPKLLSCHLKLHEDAPHNRGFVGLVEWLPELRVTPFMRWLDGTNLQFAFHTGLRPGPLPHPSDAFYTCNLSLRRSLFEACGGFDERFPYPAYEDIEIGMRLADVGLELHYRPEALAWHARAITLREFATRMGKVAESAVLLQQSHPELPVDTTGMLDARRSRWQRTVLSVVAPVLPRAGRRDLRSARYWSEIAEAWAAGLDRAHARPT
jgi:GT2 family glycosyltransferase